MAGGSRFRVTPAAAPEQPETEQLQNALLVPPMSLAWRGPSGQPTHSLLHFLPVRPLQHPFSLRCVASLLWGAGEISSRS